MQTKTDSAVRTVYLKSVELARTPREEITETQEDIDNLIQTAWDNHANYNTIRTFYRVKRSLALRDKYPGVSWPAL